jgi:branched-chain amino acid transport system substrate-binding protein
MTMPFTGADGVFGSNALAACTAAKTLINSHGGINGHQLDCLPVDTRGDPADAVPAVAKMLATTSNLVGVIGPSGDEATAVAPLLDAANVPFFPTAGDAPLGQWTYRSFYRLVPPDDVGGSAMALWANQKGYKTAAALFGSDISTQGTVPTLLAGLTKLGSPRLVSNQKVALDQTSYRTEIEQLLATKPDVLFSELDAPTASTFFSELEQLAGGTMPFPVVFSNALLEPVWYSAVAKAIGGPSVLAKYFVGPNSIVATSGPAWQDFATALLASPKDVVKNPAQYDFVGTTQADFDGANLMALAMVAAKSVDPQTYAPWIVKLTQPSTGAIQVQDFTDGASALTAGKTIQFVGLAGTGINFNQWHNSPGGEEMEFWSNAGIITPIPGAVFTSTQLNALGQ